MNVEARDGRALKVVRIGTWMRLEAIALSRLSGKRADSAEGLRELNSLHFLYSGLGYSPAQMMFGCNLRRRLAKGGPPRRAIE